jgi:hypothetical protein
VDGQSNNEKEKGWTNKSDGAEEIHIKRCTPFFRIGVCDSCYRAEGAVVDDQAIDASESFESSRYNLLSNLEGK